MPDLTKPRAVVLLGWVLCFAFLTLAFLVWVPLTYTTLMDAELMQAYTAQRRPIFFVVSGLELLRCLVGPAGLVLIYRCLSKATPAGIRVTMTLIGILVFGGIALPVAYAWQAGLGSVFEYWREFVLLSVLPATALAHMHLFFARRAAEGPLTISSSARP